MSPLRRIPLSQFLVHSRQLLQASIEERKPLSLVTGNESAGIYNPPRLCEVRCILTEIWRGLADLDSFASSLLHAYLSYPGPSPTQQSNILPILPIPRADLNLRPEFIYLLSVLKIPKQDLIFIDDIPSSILTGAGGWTAAKNEVVLVDHNALQGKIFSPTRTVVRGVIDHHKDEGKYLDADPRIIEVSGSCTSLVTSWGRSKWGDWGNGPGVRQAAKLALAAILIDTSNMQTRVTPHDRSAVEFLESKLGGGGVGIVDDSEGNEVEGASTKQPWNSTNFYLKLFEAKCSLDSLSTYDILRKDFKAFTTTSPPDTIENKPGRTTPTLVLGISSVVKPLPYLASSPRGGPEALVSTLYKFSQERNIDVAAVMASFTDEATGRFSRQLLVWEISEEAHRAEYMKQFVKWAESEKGAMGLQPLGGEEGLRGLEDGEGRRRVWRQGNTDMSRKQVAPGMRECL